MRTKRRCVTGSRRCAMQDSIIFEASERARQDVGVIGADAGVASWRAIAREGA